MLIELHAHTHHSHGTKVFYDGTNSPEEMIVAAKNLGLGAIAITDHDHMNGVKEALKAGKKHNIIVIPGEEVTSYHGHTLALGIQEAIKPGMTIQDTVDAIHAQGGIAVSPHPFDIKHEGLREHARFCDAMEIFNAHNLDRLSNNKARKFSSKLKMPGTAGSDAHHTSMIGHGIVEMKADSIDDILKNIKNNKFQTRVKYPSLKTILNVSLTRLRMSYDYTSDYIENNYSFPKKYIASSLLGLVHRKGAVKYMFNGIAYVSLAGVVTYSAARRVIGK